MNSDEALKIYDCLSSKGKEGMSLLTLSKITHITTPELKKYLQEFSKSFVRIGTSTKYRINSFNVTENHRKYLLSELEKYNKKKTLKSIELFIVIGSAIFVSLIVTISNGI